MGLKDSQDAEFESRVREAKSKVWGTVSLAKMAEALALLNGRYAPRVLFMPDIVRDGILLVPPTKNISADLDPKSEKNRLRDYTVFVKGGGHAFIGAYAAAALRMETDAEVAISARIYERDRKDLVDWYMVENLQKLGARPIETSLVFQDHGDRSSLNIVVEQCGLTPIITGKQPSLRLSGLEEEPRAALLREMRNADVVAALSVKAPSFRETVKALIDGELVLSELFSDCTSGDDMGANYEVLDVLRMKKADGRSPITLLSINSHEARLYAALLGIEDEGRRQEVIEGFAARKKSLATKDGADPELERRAKACDALLEASSHENSLEAARFLNSRLAIPLLYHSSQGSCIIDSTGARSTRFIPSVMLRTLPDNFVGAGDTLCGGMALALAVKRKLDEHAEGFDPWIRMSFEDCLIIANLVTCYRLERIAELSKDGRPDAWHFSVGNMDQLIEWSRNVKYNKATETWGKQQDPALGSDGRGGESPGHVAIPIEADLLQFVSRPMDGWVNQFPVMLREWYAAAVTLRKRNAGAEPISVDQARAGFSSFITSPDSCESVAFIKRLRDSRFSEGEISTMAFGIALEHIYVHPLPGGSGEDLERASRVMGPHMFARERSRKDLESAGRILGELGRAAFTSLLELMGDSHGKNFQNTLHAARGAGNLFLQELCDALARDKLFVMLYPWRNARLDRLIAAAGELGGEDTAMAISRLIPTRSLEIPPPHEAPSVRALYALKRIAQRTGLSNPDVAQALYEAEQAHCPHVALSLVLKRYEQLCCRYNPNAFCNAASSAREVVESNLRNKGIKFEPRPHPWDAMRVEYDQDRHRWFGHLDEGYVEDLARRALKEKSVDFLSERDYRDMREKMLVLRRIQARFLLSNPRTNKLIGKDETMPRRG